jgi:hypothetical protein
VKREAAVQNQIRLAGTQNGVLLFRNNVGALPTENGYVRFGLANDSAQMNRQFKSGDLIGITQITITPDMVGQTIGVFTSIECKAQGWAWSGSEREQAQKRWADIIRKWGGKAGFASSVDTARRIWGSM